MTDLSFDIPRIPVGYCSKLQCINRISTCSKRNYSIGVSTVWESSDQINENGSLRKNAAAAAPAKNNLFRSRKNLPEDPYFYTCSNEFLVDGKHRKRRICPVVSYCITAWISKRKKKLHLPDRRLSREMGNKEKRMCLHVFHGYGIPVTLAWSAFWTSGRLK